MGEDVRYDKDAKSVEEIVVDRYLFRKLSEASRN